MTRRGKRKRTLTERDVVGIYAENQSKIENIPGYAEAFERVSACLRKYLADDYRPSGQDDDQLKRAMGELFWIEMLHRYPMKSDQAGDSD